MRLVGANESPHVVGLDLLPGESHYLIGGEPAGWRTHVRHYGRVAYRNVYPGIDLVFYSRAGRLEYDFDVQPGADEGAIELAFDGMDEARIDDGGDIVLRVPGGQLRHRRPTGFEGAQTERRRPATRFSRKADGRFGFRVEGRDRRRPLRIDPQLEWIRLPGASNDWSYDVAVDPDGNTYLTGMTWSADFPSVGGMPPDNVESGEAFVVKLGPQQQIIYSTFFGAASAADIGRGIAVDAQGQAVVSGETYGNMAEVSAAHPGVCATDAGVTGFLALLAVDGASFRFSTCLPAETGQAVAVEPLGSVTVVGWTVADAYIGRYLPTGQYVFTQTWGGSSGDWALDVALDAAGHAVVVGRTNSSNLPGTSGGLQPTLPYGGGFVAEFTPTGGLARATYLGGSGGRSGANGIALDRLGDVYVTGWTLAADFPLQGASRKTLRDSPWGPVPTAFVTKLHPNLHELVYSTFYAQENVPVDGTVEYVSSEEGRKVAVDSAGNAYLIGQALTFNDATYFEGVFAWLAAFDPAGQPTDNALLDLTANGDEAYGIAITDSGDLYIVGHVDLLWECDASGCWISSAPDVFVGRIPPGGEIVILPSTTRWRAQKDYSRDASGNPVNPDPLNPVVINFTAPKGYTATALDITDPNGVLLADQKVDITGPANPNADPGQYAITWSGPWSWKDPTTGQPKYHPTGNYTFTVKGTTANSTPLDSDPTKPCAGATAGTPSCSIVSLVEVTGVNMVDKPGTRGRVLNNELGGRGGGWAIFPEARNPSPNDQVGDEDKVQIVATVTPAVPDPRTQGAVTVYFRGLDVDDPSANKAPVDDEGYTYDNCLGNECAVPAAGNLKGQDADAPVLLSLPVGLTQVTVDLQASDRQGDNYRVAASTSSTWLQGLSAKQNSASGEVLHSRGEQVLDLDAAKGPQASEMLTVWRTLHLEVDHLDSSVVAQTQADADASTSVVLDMTGDSTKIEPQKLTDDNASFVVKPPKGVKEPTDHAKNGDWLGADLWPKYSATSPDGFVKVSGNGKTHLDVRDNIDLTVLANTGDSYRLSDDRNMTLTGSVALGLMQSLLRRVYIQAEPVVSDLNPDAAHIFRRNLAGDRQAALDKNATSSPSFWSVQLIEGFEGPVVADNDPSDPEGPDSPRKNEPGTLGQTVGHPKIPDILQPVCSVFLEAIRDRKEEARWQRPIPAIAENVMAHEVICHALDWGHEYASLCFADYLEGPTGQDLSEDHLVVLRRLKQPRVDAGSLREQ